MDKIIADFVADAIKPDNQLISLKFNDMSKEESAGFVGELRLLDKNGA